MTDHPNEQKESNSGSTNSASNAQGDDETIVLKETQSLPVSSTGDSSEQKYEIIRELGKGGFAWVYLARNLQLDRLEAVKILSSKVIEDQEVIDRFVKEARISANFSHQNIVTIFEVEKNGTWSKFKASPEIRQRHQEPFVYFSMSFVEGETATSIIKTRGRMPQKQAVKITMDACCALEYAHGKGVIHRDIKPENILVNRRGDAVVSDFGIAKVADQTKLTAAGTFMGTARYVSPEQAMGQEIDGRSDLYSLGITLYEMVTGKVPFESDQWMTVLYQHINEAPPPPEEYHRDIDRSLQTTILKMLEKKPERRFQNARELHDVLRRVFQKLGGDDLSTEAMDKIRTRADFLKDQSTAATVLERPAASEEPPVRKQDETATPGMPVERPWWAGRAFLASAALIAVLAAVAWFTLIQPRTRSSSDGEAGPVPVASGQVLISAYPKGVLEQIKDEAGNLLPSENAALPQLVELPPGEYVIVVSYAGKHQKLFTYISAEKRARAHAEFTVDGQRFLLEDLR